MGDAADHASSLRGPSPLNVLEHRHVMPEYYEETVNGPLGKAQAFVIVPPPTSSLSYLLKAETIARKPWSSGCQSPCGNMWLAAIAMLFEKGRVLQDLIHRRRGTAPGRNSIEPATDNKYVTKVFLSHEAARSLAKAFLEESTLQEEEYKQYEDAIVEALWGFESQTEVNMASQTTRHLSAITSLDPTEPTLDPTEVSESEQTGDTTEASTLPPTQAGGRRTSEPSPKPGQVQLEMSPITAREIQAKRDRQRPEHSQGLGRHGGNRPDRHVWLLYCTLEELPKRVRQWFYLLEVGRTESYEYVQQVRLSDHIMSHTIVQVNEANAPGRTVIETPDGRRRTILSIAAMSPHGGNRGYFHVERNLPYERILGLVSSKRNEVMEGAMVLGTTTGWIARDDSEIAFVTDAEGSGRWYSVQIEREKGVALIRTCVDVFAQLVSGSPSAGLMALRMKTWKKNPGSSDLRVTDEGESGIVAAGRSVGPKRVVVGYKPTSERGGPKLYRNAVADPSAIPCPLGNHPRYLRRIPANPLPLTAIVRMLIGVSSSYGLLAALITGLTAGDMTSKDMIVLMAFFRLSIGMAARLAIFGISIRQRAMKPFDALYRLFLVRSIDSLALGVPWGLRDLSDLSYSFWWRRASIRFRAAAAMLLIGREMYLAIETHGSLPTESGKFIVGLILAPALVLRDGGLGTFFDETIGARLTGGDMTTFMSCCAVLDVIATLLICIMGILDTRGNRPEFLGALIFFTLLETITYAATLLRARAILRAGLDQEDYTCSELTSESEGRLGSLHHHIEASATAWGLGGVANRPDMRGILTLFETTWNNKVKLQATSPLVTLADWVAVTQAGGFQLTPMLRSDALVYEARDFEGKLEKYTKTNHLPLYANVKLMYVQTRAPWTGTHFPELEIPMTGERHHQKGDGRQHVEEWSKKPRQAAVMLSQTVLVPLREALADDCMS